MVGSASVAVTVARLVAEFKVSVSEAAIGFPHSRRVPELRDRLSRLHWRPREYLPLNAVHMNSVIPARRSADP